MPTNLDTFESEADVKKESSDKDQESRQNEGPDQPITCKSSPTLSRATPAIQTDTDRLLAQLFQQLNAHSKWVSKVNISQINFVKQIRNIEPTLKVEEIIGIRNKS